MVYLKPRINFPKEDEFYDKVGNSVKLQRMLSLPDGVKVGIFESGNKAIAPQKRLAKTNSEFERLLYRQYYSRHKYEDNVSLSYYTKYLKKEIKRRKKKAENEDMLSLIVAETADRFIQFLKNYSFNVPERPSICKDSNNDSKVDRILLLHDYIDKELNWKGTPAEFIAAYWALQKHVFKPGNYIPKARWFGSRYNVKIDKTKKEGAFLVERNFSETKEVFNDTREEMERIFKDLLPETT